MTDSNGLLSPEFLANPYPMLKLLRDQAPLAFIEPMNMYVAVGYDAARAILMDPRRFFLHCEYSESLCGRGKQDC